MPNMHGAERADLPVSLRWIDKFWVLELLRNTTEPLLHAHMAIVVCSILFLAIGSATEYGTDALGWVFLEDRCWQSDMVGCVCCGVMGNTFLQNQAKVSVGYFMC